MIAIENRPELARSDYETELRVDRTDITFEDLPGDKVRIQVTVHNPGESRSQPTSLGIESAPLGAFVPWRPLKRLLVPALEPGESRQIATEVARPRPVPLGDFNRVPPGRVLTALSSAEQNEPSQQSVGGLGAMLNLLRRGRPTGTEPRDQRRANTLADDIWDLHGRRQPHWAGNINVFVGRQSVERHLARALRVYAGRTNLAMFMVGTPGKRDAYSFELVGLDPHWQGALYNVTTKQSFLFDSKDLPIAPAEWVASDRGLMVMLATRPPENCEKGNLEVHVTRRSTGTSAIVEFDLDPAAQGTGCYYM